MAKIRLPEFETESIKTEENVILLCLSTLNEKPRISHYGKDSYHFNGLVQLEPGTKYFLTKLSEEGKQADRIIILESPEVRRKLADYEDGYYKAWDTDKSASEIYRERILAFLRGTQAYCAGQENAVSAESRINPQVKYREEDLENLFVEIQLERENRMFFPQMIESIKSRTEDGKVDLYIDMQGGDRSMAAQINAITELLRDQGVTVKERIAIRYRSGKEKQLIEDVGEQYRSYELITAMNVFKRYGWGNELVEYFKDDESKPVRNLVVAIKKASQAIMLCDVCGFDDAVTYIGKLEKMLDPAGMSEMDIVCRDIYEDFKPLIAPKYRYVEQIRWCLKKNFIQQALTIFESKMPTEFVRSGLKYYCDREEDVEILLDIAAETCYDLGKSSRFQFKDINHYFIRSQGKKSYPAIWKEKYGIADTDSVKRAIENYEDICGLRNGMNHANDTREGRFIRHAKDKYPGLTFDNANLEGVVNQIRKFLKDFEALADRVPKEIKEQVIDLGQN